MGEINEKWENELGLSDIDSSFLETFKGLTSRAIDINKGKIQKISFKCFFKVMLIVKI